MQISYELLKKEVVSAKKNCQVWLYGQCTSGVGSCKMKLYLMFLLYVSKCYYHTDKPNLGRLVLGYFVLTFLPSSLPSHIQGNASKSFIRVLIKILLSVRTCLREPACKILQTSLHWGP